MKKIQYKILLFLSFVLVINCSKDEGSNYTEESVEPSTNPIDIYINEKLTKPYDARVIWRWNYNLVGYSDLVTPPNEEVVIPAVDMILNYWIEPFAIVDNGEEFVKNNFPIEFILLGSPNFNEDGTVTLGIAEGGVRVTLTELDYFDEENPFFLQRQLHTILHEFTHIVHQSIDIPVGWQEINPAYSGSDWINLTTNDAIERGCVTPYGTSNEDEDFAEFVSTYITTPFDEFSATYLEAEDCSSLSSPDDIQDCTERNAGRGYLLRKLELMRNYFSSNFKIDIDEVRDNIVDRIENGVD